MNPKTFLALVEELIKNPQPFQDAVTWKESKWDTPELVPVVQDSSVDVEKFKAFEKLLNFLVLGIFGVDEEGRSRGQLVEYYLKNTRTDATAFPFWKIPKINCRESTLRNIMEGRKKAQFHAELTQRLVEHYDKELAWLLEQQFDKEDFLSRAQECPTCEGKGYIMLEREDYRNRSRAAHDSESDEEGFIQRTDSRLGNYLDIPFMGILCNICQPDETIDEISRKI